MVFETQGLTLSCSTFWPLSVVLSYCRHWNIVIKSPFHGQPLVGCLNFFGLDSRDPNMQDETCVGEGGCSVALWMGRELDTGIWPTQGSPAIAGSGGMPQPSSSASMPTLAILQVIKAADWLCLSQGGKEAVTPLQCVWSMVVALERKKWEVFLWPYTPLVCKTCWIFVGPLGSCCHDSCDNSSCR